MPLRIFTSKADYDAIYATPYAPIDGELRAITGLSLGYERSFGLRIGERIADEYLNADLGWQPTTHIAIIGCGFGWSVEALEARGFTNILGIDTGQYIQAAKDGDEEADVDAKITAAGLSPSTGLGALIKAGTYTPGPRTRCTRGIANEGLLTAVSIDNVLAALGGTCDVAISESLLHFFTNNEAQVITTRMGLLAPTVVHYLITTRPGMDTTFNSKTLEQWKSLLPTAIIIEAGTGRKL